MPFFEKKWKMFKRPPLDFIHDTNHFQERYHLNYHERPPIFGPLQKFIPYDKGNAVMPGEIHDHDNRNEFSTSPPSKKQATLALSTAKAEYQAMAAAVQEAIYLRALLEDFGFPMKKPIDIGEDSQSCINSPQGTPSSSTRCHSWHADRCSSQFVRCRFRHSCDFPGCSALHRRWCHIRRSLVHQLPNHHVNGVGRRTYRA